MSALSKFLKPAAIVGGSALLGSYFFPETMGSVTGGMLGTSATDTPKDSTSIWSNPTVLSSSILAGTSLLSGLFGSGSQEEMQQEQFDATLAQRQAEFAANQTLEREQLAQALEIAKLQAGASGAGAAASRANAASARDAALRQAKMQAIMNAAGMKSQAIQLPVAAIGEQAAAAQTTGIQSGNFFSNMMQSLQQPALARAR